MYRYHLLGTRRLHFVLETRIVLLSLNVDICLLSYPGQNYTFISMVTVKALLVRSFTRVL